VNALFPGTRTYLSALLSNHPAAGADRFDLRPADFSCAREFRTVLCGEWTSHSTSLQEGG
jgi:hypothetical protein